MRNAQRHTDHLNIFTPGQWIDSKTSLELEKQFDDAIARGVSNMVVDCGNLDYISSAGIRAICKTAKKLQPINGTIVLCALEDYVEEVFDISGINSLMVITKNLDDAMHYLAGKGNA